MDIHQFEPLWNAWYIRNLIGSGSYGVVYRAEKTIKGHTFECAIKYISIPKDEAELLNLENDLHFTDSSDINQYLEEYAQKTLNEYISLQQFDAFPNFVHVQDILMLEKKDMPGYDMFIRMEKLNSIKELFKSDSVNEQEVIRLGSDICTALVEMHKRDLVHRDIKPQNILVSDDGIYKLADFGSVHKLSGTSSAMSMKGTFDYTAPEVFLGSPADSRVDIYSLGIVMYQLLNKHVSLSIRVPGDKLTLPQNVFPGLADIVLKACEYYPDKRWNTAEEMLDALHHIEKANKVENSTDSVHSAKDSGENKKTTGKTKRRLWFSVIAVCVVFLAALSVYLSGALDTIFKEQSISPHVSPEKEHSFPAELFESAQQTTDSEKETESTVAQQTIDAFYTITWLDDTGNVIDTAEYAYGTLPEHSEPIKKADAQYSYTFSGWFPDVEKVTDNAVYKATYSPATNKYTITWQDDAGNVIDTAEYAYGTVPEHSEPIKKADAEYSYIFNGWSPNIEKVTGNAVYKATFSPETNYYTITWQDDTGRVIDTVEYAYGTVPEHSDPIKKADAQYSYTFSGWSPAVEKATSNAIYKATFSPVTNNYTVTWQDDTGSVIDTTEYAYGAVPEHSVPTKKADAQYSYTFSGWFPAVEKVTADAVYKATYSSVNNNYTVIWVDDTGRVIDTAEYAYGTVPDHSDPTKKSDAQYSYTFIGWLPDVEKVTGNAVYKATYIPVINKYTITWQDDTGSVIDTTEYAYGAVPKHSDPIKEADAQYSYTFSGWSPAIEKVTADAMYKATYSPVTNKYTISWQDDTGAIIDSNTWEFGTLPSHENPTKSSDGQYTYTFIGWTPIIEKVTGNASYKAEYTKNAIPTPTPNLQPANTIASGKWGTCSWLIDLEGTLVISGGIGGDDNWRTRSPWAGYADEIRAVSIKDAVIAPKRCNLLFMDLVNCSKIDLNNFNTQKVTDMGSMFYGCRNLSSIDFGSFNTKNVTDMRSMFYGCRNLSSLDLSSFNTSKVINMDHMFSHCSNLSSLDLSNFRVDNVTSMRYMFERCISLSSLNLSSFSTRNSNTDNILYHCTSLNTLILGPHFVYSASSSDLSGIWKSNQTGKTYSGESLLKSHPKGKTAKYTKEISIEEKANEFIKRCYRCILGREASQTELNNWVQHMISGAKSSDLIARDFLFSEEFKNKQIGNEELVRVLYRVYMNREADPKGLALWTEKLNKGMALNDLLDTFIQTSEYKKVIKNMGL